jgi:hypothetical protein
MKKALFLALALVLCVGFASAESYANKDGLLLAPGTLAVKAGVGYGWGYGLTVVGGAEYMIGQFTLGDTLHFTYGAGARAGLDIGAKLRLGIGALGVLHFSFASFDWPKDLSWLDNLDMYIGIGIALTPINGYSNNFIDLISIGGWNYFLSKDLALYLESGYPGSTFGVLLKL